MDDVEQVTPEAPAAPAAGAPRTRRRRAGRRPGAGGPGARDAGGRGARGPGARAAAARAWLPPLGALLVLVVGLAVLWSGLAHTRMFGGEAPLTGRLSTVTQPVVVTAPGMSELSGSRFTVHATAPDGSTVFIGVGRTDDVDAYLGDVARAEVTALEPGGDLRVTAHPGDPSLPDPADVDVWATAVRRPGQATLTWPRAPGSWRVVVAVDGRAAPSSAEFTWAGRAGSSPAPALISIGAVLAVLGLAALLAIRSGRVFARADRPPPPRPAPSTGPLPVTGPTPLPGSRRASRAADGRPDGDGDPPRDRPGSPTGRRWGRDPGRRDVDLRDPDLRDPDVRDPDPQDADVRETDVRDADVRDTDVRHTDVRHTDLRHTDVRHTDLWETDLRDTDDETTVIQPFRHRRPREGDR